ncbi:fatty acyl-CoA reductase 1-like [Miscanthus floridulus]|uniref:fatty acyl-CoA reductase 1-like n=1 Tax=Miscanthus floridulus TaxID=154761 RepID=UPI003458D329
MMVDSMDAARIIDYFKGKCILVTGSTGFLGKILVEKILRVQPDVHKIYLIVRAIDEPSAKQRVQQEVIDTELFGLLKEKHGKGFQQFVDEKVVALAGDIIYDGLGLEPPVLDALAKDTDVIVNIAATTNFYERYDVSLDVNVMGVKHLCTFAKQCARLKLLMHVSTAFVSGFREGLILEKPIKPGDSLREGTYLDVDTELRLVKEVKKSLAMADATSDGDGGDAHTDKMTERKAMKELGLQRARHFGWSNTYVFTKAMGEVVLGQQLRRGGGSGDSDIPVVVMRPSIITSVRDDPVPGWMQGTRTIDSIIIGYAKQNLSCFLADLGLVMDVIPGDMVVNAMMAAVVAHSGEKAAPQLVYHVTSSLRNPATYDVLYQSGRRHFYDNPRVGKDGRVIPTREMYFFNTIARFHLYMILTYKIPLEILHLVNLLLCGLFSRLYNDLNRKYKFVMHLVDVYGPFAFFKGCFDDMNLERLRLTMTMKTPEDQMFNFDPKTVDWDDYFTRIHIPGILKYLCK